MQRRLPVARVSPERVSRIRRPGRRAGGAVGQRGRMSMALMSASLAPASTRASCMARSVDGPRACPSSCSRARASWPCASILARGCASWRSVRPSSSFGCCRTPKVPPLGSGRSLPSPPVGVRLSGATYGYLRCMRRLLRPPRAVPDLAPSRCCCWRSHSAPHAAVYASSLGGCCSPFARGPPRLSARCGSPYGRLRQRQRLSGASPSPGSS